MQFDHTSKWYTYKSESVRVKEKQKIIWDFEIQADPLISTRRQDLEIIDKKKRTNSQVDCSVSTSNRVNIKESEKRDQYVVIASKLRKLWNIMVTVIPLVIGVHGTIIKGLKMGLEELDTRGRFETFPSIALLRLTIILGGVL